LQARADQERKSRLADLQSGRPADRDRAQYGVHPLQLQGGVLLAAV